MGNGEVPCQIARQCDDKCLSYSQNKKKYFECARTIIVGGTCFFRSQYLINWSKVGLFLQNQWASLIIFGNATLFIFDSLLLNPYHMTFKGQNYNKRPEIKLSIWHFFRKKSVNLLGWEVYIMTIFGFYFAHWPIFCNDSLFLFNSLLLNTYHMIPSCNILGPIILMKSYTIEIIRIVQYYIT